MEGEFDSSHITNNQSSEIGSFKTQTVITEDTIISKEVKVSGDMGLELFKGSQTYLLLTKRIKPKDLQHIFDSELKEIGIKKPSAVLIKDNDTLISTDTTQLTSFYRVPPVNGGVFDEISYEGFVYYSPFIVIQLMSKSVIMALFFLEIGMLVAIAYLFIVKRKIRPDKIVKRGRYYHIGKTIFDTRKCNLIGENMRIVALTKQPSEMLLMFLQNDEHVVRKSILKEVLWPGNPSTVSNNLTSTINKLRNYLKEVGCTFNLVTKKGLEYYELKYMQDHTNDIGF